MQRLKYIYGIHRPTGLGLVVAAMLLYFFAMPTPSQGVDLASLEVADWKLSSQVDGRRAIGTIWRADQGEAIRITRAPIFLSFVLAGNKQVVDEMVLNRSKPTIETIWYFLGYDAQNVTEREPDTDVEPQSLQELLDKEPKAEELNALSAGVITKPRALAPDPTIGGKLGWRTLSKKEALLKGWYRVYIRVNGSHYLKLGTKDHLSFYYAG